MGKIIKTITLLLVISFILMGCKEQSENLKNVKPWFGKWHSINYTDSSGLLNPWEGIYHYYEDGTFSYQGLSPARDTLETDPQTIEEYKALFNFYRAGYGKYSVNEEKGIITYEYTANLRTHRINKLTDVSFEIRGDSLILKYEVMRVQLLLTR